MQGVCVGAMSSKCMTRPMCTVWQAGPTGSDRYSRESRSQSANMRTTLMKCPDVSPLHHRPCSKCRTAALQCFLIEEPTRLQQTVGRLLEHHKWPSDGNHLAGAAVEGRKAGLQRLADCGAV